MKSVTTARGGMFTVEDVSFHGARRQSEVAKELGITDEEQKEVNIPASLTPEQLIRFYEESAEKAVETRAKVAYAQTAKYLKDYIALKQKLMKYQTQEFLESRKTKEDEGTEVDDD